MTISELLNCTTGSTTNLSNHLGGLNTVFKAHNLLTQLEEQQKILSTQLGKNINKIFNFRAHFKTAHANLYPNELKKNLLKGIKSCQDFNKKCIEENKNYTQSDKTNLKTELKNHWKNLLDSQLKNLELIDLYQKLYKKLNSNDTMFNPENLFYNIQQELDSYNKLFTLEKKGLLGKILIYTRTVSCEVAGAIKDTFKAWQTKNHCDYCYDVINEVVHKQKGGVYSAKEDLNEEEESVSSAQPLLMLKASNEDLEPVISFNDEEEALLGQIPNDSQDTSSQ
jgi:hypothetical protein